MLHTGFVSLLEFSFLFFFLLLSRLLLLLLLLLMLTYDCLVASHFNFEQLGLSLVVVQLFAQHVIFALQVAGSQRDLILFHAASVSRSLRCHVILSPPRPILVVFEFVGNELLFSWRIKFETKEKEKKKKEQ